MIELNVPQKLPKVVIWYWSVQSLLGSSIVAAVLLFISWQGPINATVNGKPSVVDLSSWGIFIIPGALILFCLFVLYGVIYYSMYSFMVGSDQISISSGVVFPSTKVVEFKNIQNISTNRGPILMAFGLAILQGFTSSLGQLEITSSRNSGTTTTHRPDVSVPLVAADAEYLRELISKAVSVQKVQMVS